MEENEIRGAVSATDLQRIERVAAERSWSRKEYRQLAIYCDTDSVAAIGSVKNGRARLIIDIRNTAVILKVKIGNALAKRRNEYKLKTAIRSIGALTALLKLFGVTNGFIRSFDRIDYFVNRQTTLTTKTNCLMGDHFELEGVDTGVESLAGILKDLALRAWSRTELAEAIERDHKLAVSENIEVALTRMGLL